MKKYPKLNQDKVLPIRLNSHTYSILRDNAESIGVKPTIFVKSLIINALVPGKKYSSLNEFKESLIKRAKITDKGILKLVNKEINNHRNRNKC